jgi:diguanylate cyclase (GGDEF)-like protein/PAS domain S-box-containing protein
VAGSDASIVLGALPVGLQLWAADAGGLTLRWSNHDEAIEAGEAAARTALDGETVDAVEAHADGWIRVRARPLGDGRVVVSFEDVTALAASERLSASIVDCLQQALVVVNMAGTITRSNAVAAELCGVSLGELVGSQLVDLPIKVFDTGGKPLDPTRSPIHRALGGETVHRMLVQVERYDGTTLWVEVSSCPLSEPDGSRYGAMSTYADVTGRVERERRIRQQAETDDLTGLPNRRALGHMLGSALMRAEMYALAVGVLMLDLDGFKAVNDRFGHAAGDAALREVAGRLRSSVRGRDMVARTGGDEFVVVLADLGNDENAAHEAALRMEAAFSEPLDLDGTQVQLRAAVGVACFPSDGSDLDELLAAADRAMYARKAAS